MKDNLPIQFKYLIEVVKDGRVIDSEVVDNIVPTEGLNHILNTVLKGGVQVPQWYLGVYEGNYTPVAGDTAAGFAAAATESSSYSGTTRPAYTPGAVAGGAVSNSTSVTEFTFNAQKTIYGGFMVSSNVRGGTAGVLLSAVKFASAKAMEPGAILRVTAGLTLNSVA